MRTGAGKTEIVIWRDSVAAGDDVDAPHELKLTLPAHESLDSLVTRVIQSSSLASIAGGKATWILKSGERALAVVAQQWPAASFLVSAEVSARSYLSGGECDLEFVYWCQVDPDRVFDCLANGKPLPDRHGA
jgi:hypothetical protein